MEDKQLTNQQSLDLIAKMISDTRRNFNDRGGAMFLIWGYTTIAVTLAVYFAFRFTRSYDTMWLWWALPLIAGVLTWFHYRKNRRPVQSHLDKSVRYVWIAFSVAAIACSSFCFIPSGILPHHYSLPILFIIGLMISVATAITGLMIKFRSVAIGGFAGIVLSFVILLLNGTIEQFLAFAGLFLLVQVIPGHLLNAACKHEAEERRAV